MKPTTPRKRIFDGKTPVLFIDQYGRSRGYHRTLKSLLDACCRTRAAKMYADKLDGTTVQVGYVIGPDWLTAYHRVEVVVSDSPDGTTNDERINP